MSWRLGNDDESTGPGLPARLDRHATMISGPIGARLATARETALRTATVRVQLDAHAGDVSADVHARLADARRRAVAHADAPVRGQSAWHWLGGGVAVAALAVVLVWSPDPDDPLAPQTSPAVVSAPVDDAEPMPEAFADPEALAAADLDLLEDMEFLAWLQLEVDAELAEAG